MKKEYLFFFGIIILMSLFYDYHNILFKKNQSIHQWRQADCLSITQNYYKENLPLHTPKIHHMSDKEGKRGVASEFPIVYYVTAQIWKVFGKSEAVLRGINLFIVFLGLFYLFKTTSRILDNDFYAIILSVFIFTSPVLVFYSNNFLTDAPAFGLALIGWYFFYSYYKNNEREKLFKAFLFFLLAGLLKASALFSFFAIGGIYLLELIPKVKFGKVGKLFLPRDVFYFLAELLLVFGWYYYATWYSEKQGNSYVFLKGILPIWDLDPEGVYDRLDKLIFIQAPRVFNSTLQILTLIVFIFNMVNFKKVNPLLGTLNLFLFIGVFLFFMLFFQVFNQHDYYIINCLILYLFTWITFFHYLKTNTSLLSRKYIQAITALSFVFLVFISGVNIRHRYNTDDVIAQAGRDYLSDQDKGVFGWFQHDFKKNIEAFHTITPYLRKLGIKREDVVIVLGDGSINISLYNMDQRGYTNYCNVYDFENPVELAKSFGCKYLFISEHKINEYKEYEKYMKKQIGKYKNLLIYDVRD